MGLFGPSTQIGVSIGTSSVKIAEIKKSGKKYSLEHFGVAQLPDEAIVNREIVNHMAVVDALRSLVQELKIKGRSVTTSLSGSAVIMKKILIDPIPAKELDDAILWEAEQYIPFDINEVVFDYQVVNKNGPEGKMEVVLVACKRNIVESYQDVMKEAGLVTDCVDIDLFALINTFEHNYPQNTPAALVDIGAGSMKFLIYSNGQPIFSRDVVVGGRGLTAEIQKHMNLSYMEAEMLKIDGNMQGQMPQELADLVQMTVENISSEIKRSIDFFTASSNGVNVGYILLSGGSSRLLNLTKTVEEQCSLPTQHLNPFSNTVYNSKFFTEESIQAISGIAAIPMGLAFRGFQR